MFDSALATDLYQLTMTAGYFVAGRHQTTSAPQAQLGPRPSSPAAKRRPRRGAR